MTEVRSSSGDTSDPSGTVRSFLRHPLFIAAATLVATVFFADRIAQVSGDRQRELDLKQRLVTQVAESSTSAVASALEAAETAPRVQQRKALYSRLAGRWSVEWSRVNSQLQVYFEDEKIHSEWNTFADRFDKYLRVAVLRAESRKTETNRLQQELVSEAFLSDADERRLASQVDWDCIKRPTNACPFLDDLALAGQLLLLHRADLDRLIREKEASGFAHGVLPPW